MPGGREPHLARHGPATSPHSALPSPHNRNDQELGNRVPEGYKTAQARLSSAAATRERDPKHGANCGRGISDHGLRSWSSAEGSGPNVGSRKMTGRNVMQVSNFLDRKLTRRFRTFDFDS